MVLKNTVEIKLGVLLMHGLKRENIATEDIETFFVLNKKKNPTNYDMRREINSFHSLGKIASLSNSIHIHRITTSKQRVIFSLT